jgi:uncharacterized protein (DUF885 family)
MGSIRFAESTHLPPESDFSQWPGVYVHPGTFKPASDRPRTPEACERYRDRLKRLKQLYDQRARQRSQDRNDPQSQSG